MVELSKAAQEFRLPLHPDGLFENRLESIKQNLITHDIVILTNPAKLSGTFDMSTLPFISIVDLIDHLKLIYSGDKMKEFKHWTKNEGYQMYKDCYVHCIKVGYFEEHTGYCYAKGDVKTRTNDRDPVTKSPFYRTWIILNRELTDKVIHSAFCTCKGG